MGSIAARQNAMQAEYAHRYAALATQHWWWLARRKVVVSHVRRLARTARIEHILDVGCGDGSLLSALAEFGDARGVEPDADVIPHDSPFRDRIRVAPFNAEYEDDRTYDLVLMLDVLEHIEDDAGAARRLYDLLRPDGYAIVTVPAFQSLWSMHDVVNRHFRRYVKATLGRVLREAGFEVEVLRYMFGWTAGALLLRRVLSPARDLHEGANGYRVSVPARPVNAVLHGLCRMEEGLVGATVGLPVGSSLLAVLRRVDATPTGRS